MKCEECQSTIINNRNWKRSDWLRGYVETKSKKVCLNCGSSEIFIQKINTGSFTDYGGRELKRYLVKAPSKVSIASGYNASIKDIVFCWKCKKALARLDWKLLLKRKVAKKEKI